MCWVKQSRARPPASLDKSREIQGAMLAGEGELARCRGEKNDGQSGSRGGRRTRLGGEEVRTLCGPAQAVVRVMDRVCALYCAARRRC